MEHRSARIKNSCMQEADVSFSSSSRTQHLELITLDKQHRSSCALFPTLKARFALTCQRRVSFTCHGRDQWASTSPRDMFSVPKKISADPSRGSFATTVDVADKSPARHCNMTPTWLPLYTSSLLETDIRIVCCSVPCQGLLISKTKTADPMMVLSSE